MNLIIDLDDGTIGACKWHNDNICDLTKIEITLIAEAIATGKECSIENLKKLADKMGYKLIKKAAKEHYLPCICGCRQREHIEVLALNEEILKCKHCGRSIQGKKSETRTLWNNMIRGIKKDNENKLTQESLKNELDKINRNANYGLSKGE